MERFEFRLVYFLLSYYENYENKILCIIIQYAVLVVEKIYICIIPESFSSSLTTKTKKNHHNLNNY